MDTVVLVVVVCVMIGMVAIMFNYARFIHKGPETNEQENPPGDSGDTLSDNDQ